MNSNSEKEYWSLRYKEEKTGWDLGAPSTPLKEYINQLDDKSIKILIPGAGSAYEAEYLFNKGFKNVFILDIAPEPLQDLRKRVRNFPTENLLLENFFKHAGEYDLILEQTFFCSFVPTEENRKNYASKMYSLLKPNGKLVGLWFNIPLTGDLEKRPFGGSKNEYLSYLNPYFETKVFENCHNSINPRSGNELFGIFIKRD